MLDGQLKEDFLESANKTRQDGFSLLYHVFLGGGSGRRCWSPFLPSSPPPQSAGECIQQKTQGSRQRTQSWTSCRSGQRMPVDEFASINMLATKGQLHAQIASEPLQIRKCFGNYIYCKTLAFATCHASASPTFPPVMSTKLNTFVGWDPQIKGVSGVSGHPLGVEICWTFTSHQWSLSCMHSYVHMEVYLSSFATKYLLTYGLGYPWAPSSGSWYHLAPPSLRKKP